MKKIISLFILTLFCVSQSYSKPTETTSNSDGTCTVTIYGAPASTYDQNGIIYTNCGPDVDAPCKSTRIGKPTSKVEKGDRIHIWTKDRGGKFIGYINVVVTNTGDCASEDGNNPVYDNLLLDDKTSKVYDYQEFLKAEFIK